jgi:hypothetical protein
MNKTLDLLIDEEISKASSDLLLKESFYPLVLAGMPRAVSGRVLSAAVGWSALSVRLLVSPDFFQKRLTARNRVAATEHERSSASKKRPRRVTKRSYLTLNGAKNQKFT